MHPKPCFEQIKPGIALLFEYVLNRRIDDFLVDSIALTYKKWALEEFWNGYLRKTASLLSSIKKNLPLVFRNSYVVFFHEPQMTLQEGDFFLQASASNPGTLALKFYWNEALRPSVVKDSEVPHLTDEQFYKERCRESNVGTNVFRNMILRKGKNVFERLPIRDIFQMAQPFHISDNSNCEASMPDSSEEQNLPEGYPNVLRSLENIHTPSTGSLPHSKDQSISDTLGNMSTDQIKNIKNKKDTSPADFLLDQSTPIIDLMVPQVHVALRDTCTLLDERDPLGNDWRALSTELTGRRLSNEKAFREDSGGSPTLTVLNKWQQKCLLQNATVGHLLISLNFIHRRDAVDLLCSFLKKEAADFLLLNINRISVLLSRVSPVVDKELTPAGLDLTISEGKCTLSIPPGAVDKSIPVSSCLFSDVSKYKDKTGVALSDVVQLLPHGATLKKAATLRLKHSFAFRKEDAINVTLLYESGADSGKLMKPLCVFTTLNQVVSFQFGHAVLLPDQLIVHTTSFCHTAACLRNNSCSFEASMVILAPTKLNRQDFTVKLIICNVNEEKKEAAIDKELGGNPKGKRAYEQTDTRSFDVCECQFAALPDEKLPVTAEIVCCQTAARSVVGTGPRGISLSTLQAISKDKHGYIPYDFVFLRSDSSRKTVDDCVIASFRVGTITQLTTSFEIENRSSSSGSPRAGLSLASGSDLDRKVTIKDLQRVAFHIAASCWKTLACELDVNADAVEQKNRADPSSCPFDTLNRWLNQKGSHATVRRLCKTLTDKRIGQRNAAEKVYGIDVVNQITEHPE